MASIHRLNQPSNPRDFVNGNLENHPFFAPDGHRGHHGHRGRRAWDNAQQSNNTTGVAQSGKTTKPSDNIGKDGTSASDFDSPDNHRHHGHSGKCKNKAHGCPGHHGPDLFRGKGGKGKHGHGPHAGPYDFHSYDHDHYHATGAFGGPGHVHGRDTDPTLIHTASPVTPTTRGSLVLAPVDKLSAGLGFLMNGPTAEGVDFAPSVDVFDCPDKYIVHVSLPGAKKGDLSLDYEADESVLHLAGVVYRPGVNEDLHKALVMEERGQHVGVFEREVRLGTRVPPAFVIVDQISAKLEDDVNVTLPKIVQHPEVGKKEVFVEDGDLENAKEALVVDEKTFSPVESEGSDVEEGEAREFVKVLVQ
ncbi:hypothetical protein E8E15_004995 [Penicillium rubens]|uniref:Pc16g14310 protein n=1 Tax=Penicillium rubens (strain ATCC 28089 / DSM 1075 / NRRL 1951 / Wisconsin 54-1255) TaxID=500485 RepID=B6H9X8_PENRW|nr:hypothetical protein E8E15_004995 [Penicillium rubens]CAP94101.1 Pc16g14310 [Penicillium rubens Wisconsin 54-1255]